MPEETVATHFHLLLAWNKSLIHVNLRYGIDMSRDKRQGVAAATGHMTDAPGREKPRFPASKVEKVRRLIAERIDRFNVFHGFSSAARGSDILFIGEVLRRGGMAHVFLPFPREDFARTSVGHGWEDRYVKILTDPHVTVTELSQMFPSSDEQPAAYDHCNKKVQDAAMKCAKSLGVEPLLIAVWNGNPGDGTGGTADAVRNWQQHNYQLELIDLSKL
jgi:hypothetical protein